MVRKIELYPGRNKIKNRRNSLRATLAAALWSRGFAQRGLVPGAAPLN
jgi:hypothetical protein